MLETFLLDEIGRLLGNEPALMSLAHFRPAFALACHLNRVNIHFASNRKTIGEALLI
jgi:hypothetical protein